MPPLSLPPHLRPLLDLFALNGASAYPVGGCVRDSLCGKAPHDWDVAVTTPPEVTQSICEAAGLRVVPTGLKHGTVTVLAPLSGDPADRTGAYEPVECTTCRTEGGYTDGRHPDAVAFTGRIEDDLSRRDFTINAMAYARDPATGALTVLDLFGGQADLAAGLIRCVGDPDTRFEEDALRLLRAVRFAVKMGFAIEPATAAAVRRHASQLSRISRERVSEELRRILLSPAPAHGLCLLRELNLLPYTLPAPLPTEADMLFAPTADCPPASRSEAAERPFEPTHDRLATLPEDFATRLAALLWGSDAAALDANLTSLRLPNATRAAVRAITHSRTLPVTAAPRAIREWRHMLGEQAVTALLVRRAHAITPAEAAVTDDIIARTKASEIAREPVNIADLAIDGHDLLAIGYRPGRPLQDTLCDLLELVWTDPARNTRAHLLAEAEKRRD